MDILGFPKRMMQQFEQMAHTEKASAVSNKPIKTPAVDMALSSMSERIDYLSQQFDVKELPVQDLMPLQQSLKDALLIQPHQVRAQGLLTQLAYQHQQTGPMNVEAALETHLSTLKDKPAVLDDYKESQHMLNIIRNLASAREQSMHAA
ncbi:hypothetical protein NBRC116188_24660 [Oceaniserpentilla sp. 4NH20-0058]